MEILHLEELKNISIEYPNEKTGMEENEILALEQKFNIQYPVAYKEYLFLMGKYSNIIILTSWLEYFEINQKRAQELLKQYNLSHLIQKGFWVIGDFDDAFWYFHFDEGDNPPVYRLDCENYGDIDDQYTFGKVADTFEAWINKAINAYKTKKTLENS